MSDPPSDIVARRAPSRGRRRRSRIALAAGAVTVAVAVAVGLMLAVSQRAAPDARPAEPGASLTDVAAVAAAPRPTRGAERARLRQILTFMVRELAHRDGPKDPQYFADGVWRSGNNDCWPCNAGPGEAAAILSAAASKEAATRELRRLAVSTYDGMIARHRRGDGSFGPASVGQGSRGIVTLNAALQLSTAYIALGRKLDPATAGRWRTTISGATRYVAGTIPPTYYVNGNINLGAATLFALAARITGDPSFGVLYEQQLRFTLAPPQDGRWKGFGLVLARPPTRTDGADGRGYLAESGGRAPGYDTDYVQLQTSYAAQLFVLTRDPRAQRLLNLFTNQLLTRANRRTWNLDTSGGTRHPQGKREIPFFSPALPTLAFSGRSALLRDTSGQLKALANTLRGGLTYSYGPIYRAVGDASLALLA